MSQSELSHSELEFTSPFEAVTRNPLTLIGLRMRWFSGKIRAKPNWWKKVYDYEIVTRWRKEIIEHDAAMVERFWGGDEYWKTGHGEKQWPRDKITNVQLNYLFDELRYDASRYDDETGIFATAIHKVHESRSLIPADVKISLVQGVSSLEDVPDEEKDWHPGSKKQVLDLVHPSMYCLCIGRSHVYRRDRGQGAPTVQLALEDYLSHRLDFQRFFYNSKKPFCISHDYQWLPTDFEVSESGEVEPLAPHDWYDHVTVPEPDYDDYPANRHAYHNAYAEWEWKYRWPSIPEPELFVPPTTTSADEENKIKISLHGRTLQVIVKLANIVLTPDNPKYAGGSWHVEGMANENIVATGLYYYACENITESRLDFRTAVGSHYRGIWLEYQQSDDQGYTAAFGLQCDRPLNQYLGYVVAEEDKCVAFPNVYQHHVDEFELADPTKPGYRKILCFFIVNPFFRILSTSDVPPQQEHWALDEVSKEAEKDRRKLMKERSRFVAVHDKAVFEVDFDMCEH
ncbi:hypothetical protein BD310DRAFT_976300 [Dichomitus squalens]|uniref:Uncharacterized protein n=1 Tax=Dichomitus squalens TaxID=114155 RepID=A0A4V2K8E9_9APHY|nr:hypothetical protein BD310DRAFT_976300 [Dichomitus squalens]